MSMDHRIDADERPLVFIVDDDAEIRNGVNDLLESVGIEAAAFASTREAARGRTSRSTGLHDPRCAHAGVERPRSPGSAGRQG